jgi:hypothetical protein
MTVDRSTLGEIAVRYLLEPTEQLQREHAYDVLTIVAPPPNPEGVAVILTTATLERVLPILEQAIISQCRAMGRKVRVRIEDVP